MVEGCLNRTDALQGISVNDQKSWRDARNASLEPFPGESLILVILTAALSLYPNVAID